MRAGGGVGGKNHPSTKVCHPGGVDMLVAAGGSTAAEHRGQRRKRLPRPP